MRQNNSPKTRFLKYNKNTTIDKMDCKLMLIMTLVYAVIALINLGGLKIPETFWDPEFDGQEVLIELDKPAEIGRFYIYEGIRPRSGDDYVYTVQIQDENGTYSDAALIEGSSRTMYKWRDYEIYKNEEEKTRFTTASVKLIIKKTGGPIHEIALTSTTSREPLKIKSLTLNRQNNPVEKENLIASINDEIDRFDYSCTLKTSMYFDEIYHARTALENIKGIDPYETSHPPLGKLFISVGILLFGMNPFGWRIMGTLFGIAMVPLMYLFGKKIFGKRELAFSAAFLMMFDFMHFAQTRIATIDVYVVFFIILMFYYIYDCFVYGSVEIGYKKYIIYLLLCGIMFGLGAASKWIAIYGGAGLAVLFFWGKINEIQSYGGMIEGFYNKYVIRVIFICCIFFVVIPVIIYCASYIPIQMVEGRSKGIVPIINSQMHMYKYHSTLVATHSYSSDWWSWPLNIRPVLFYRATSVGTGMTASISTMGNPAIWWLSIPAFIASIIIAIKKKDRRMIPVFAAFISQYLPWILVPRLVFIYHFFSCVPFVIFCIVYVIEYLLEIKPKAYKYIVIYMGLVAVLFFLFYPVISGAVVSIDYINIFIRWLPTWPF